MPAVTLIVILFTLALGITVLVGNPKRLSNQAFTLLCMILVSWLACVYGAMQAGNTLAKGGYTDLIIWSRANAIAASFIPWGIWFLESSIISQSNRRSLVLRRSFPVFATGLILVALCFADSFAISDPSVVIRRGVAYYLHAFVSIGLYIVVTVQISRQVRAEIGIRRLELQYLALSCGIGGLVIVIINGIGNHFHIRALNRASVLVVFAAYLFMAWALAHHRIFNARHALAVVVHRLTVLGVLAVSIWGLSIPLGQLLTDHAAWITSTIFCGIGVFWLDHKARIWMRIDDELLLAAFRGEVIRTSQRTADSAALTTGFERLLADHYNATVAVLLSRQGDTYEGGGIQLSHCRPGLAALCECAWITPESLQRRRPSPGLDDLGAFLRQNSLGVIVTTPRGSPIPTMLVAVGVKTNEWPFTYPEVQQLQNIAELMDSILTRSHLTDQIGRAHV